MPPKTKITKAEVVQTALELVRSGGEAAVNARSIAAALGCSTQPVFSNFSTMEALEGAVLEAAYQHYLLFLQNECASGKYPKYKAFGMAYIRFAAEEKQLFKLLFMRDRSGEAMQPTEDFEASVELIVQANGLSRERARLFHLEMWICVHGIATMLATSFLPLEWELISDMISDVYQGLRERYGREERDGSH